MTHLKFVLNSLKYYRRAHVGAFLGATVGAAILIGALAVGDSVKYSLRAIAMNRLGKIEMALVGGSRFFRTKLADDLSGDLKREVAPVIFLRGTATARKQDAIGDDIRTGKVQVVGVDSRFWKLAPGDANSVALKEGIALNEPLARRLGLKAGDEVLLRVEKPSLLSRDAPLSTIEDSTIAFNVVVEKVINEEQFGRFSLEANQLPPLTAFVPLPLLQSKINMEARANLLLLGQGAGAELKPEEASQALWKRWEFADSGLKLIDLKKQPGAEGSDIELRTDRVFLDPPIGQAATLSTKGSMGVLTYFVNELRVGDRSTPYSTVTAVNAPFLPKDLRPDEIVLNQWLAEDLGAKPGDQLKMKYWIVGPLRRLQENESVFKVRSVIPIAGEASDPLLMPDIPGLSDKKNCREWEPGVPVDLNKIRDKDQAYWDTHKGAPKAFIALSAGQNIWNNRFGNLTSVRYSTKGQSREVIEACIRQALTPTSLGLFFMGVRESALAATSPTFDFGQLFLGFSFFIIISALILTSLLFAFGAEQRTEQIGTLLSLGFTPRRVKRLLLLEGAGIALVASAVGAVFAVLYTRAVVYGLSTVWAGAVANSTLKFYVSPITLVVGAVSSFLVSIFSIWLVVKRMAKRPARELLLPAGTSDQMEADSVSKRAPGPLLGALLLLGSFVMVGVALAGDRGNAAGIFFGAGALLLIGGLSLCKFVLFRLEMAAGSNSTVGFVGLALRNASRRRGRSLSAIGLLASGSFLVVAVGANRHDPNEGADRRDSGTGGFALYAESTLPVFQDLTSAEGQEFYALNESDMKGVGIVPLRLQKGDEASCLNLNRAQTPSLLGVNPKLLSDRKAFGFTGSELKDRGGSSWDLLDKPLPDGVIPAIGDTNTVVWSLGKSLGATFTFTDERGVMRLIRIVGITSNATFQGSLILSEKNFIDMFPTHAGYSVFFIDAEKGRADSVAKMLGKSMEQVGLEVVRSSDRLADFATVENTYLSIFAALGGLGLLLGSVGLGVIVMRNVLERRGEMALMRAVGFQRRGLHRIVMMEHTVLLLVGLGGGVGAAIVAVLPSLLSPGANTPVGSLALSLMAVLLSGFVWTWLTTVAALKGEPLSALRSE